MNQHWRSSRFVIYCTVKKSKLKTNFHFAVKWSHFTWTNRIHIPICSLRRALTKQSVPHVGGLRRRWSIIIYLFSQADVCSRVCLVCGIWVKHHETESKLGVKWAEMSLAHTEICLLMYEPMCSLNSSPYIACNVCSCMNMSWRIIILYNIKLYYEDDRGKKLH